MEYSSLRITLFMKTASLFYCAFCDGAEYAVNFPSAAVLSGREFSSHRRTNCDDFVSSRSRQQCELRVMNMWTPQFNRFQNGGRPPFRICKIKKIIVYAIRKAYLRRLANSHQDHHHRRQ